MKKWTEEEFKNAIELNKIGYQYYEIASKLLRTERSIKNKLNKNGFFTNEKTYKEKKSCLCCNKEFISFKSENRKFCSSSCSSIINNHLHPKKIKKENTKKEILNHNNKCKNCNIDLKYSHRIFCSRNCQTEFQRKEKYEYFIDNPNDFIKNNFHPKKWLKNTILEEQNNKCKICGCINEWNDKKLIFVLDHIDGKASNNKRENLRLICPNCDSQTDTYKSKNKNSERSYRKKYYE